MKIEAPTDFTFWKRRYLYSASLYHAKNADLKRAQETVRLANAGFKAGVRTTTEVLDAELELFRARAGMVNTQMNCLEAKIKLELTTGESL
jgi:outer membrane protein TolC